MATNEKNQGVLFDNTHKKKNEKAPDWSGTINVNGKDWEIAGWRRQTKAGADFFSLKVSEPWAKNQNAAPAAKDDLPF